MACGRCSPGRTTIPSPSVQDRTTNRTACSVRSFARAVATAGFPDGCAPTGKPRRAHNWRRRERTSWRPPMPPWGFLRNLQTEMPLCRLEIPVVMQQCMTTFDAEDNATELLSSGNAVVVAPAVAVHVIAAVVGEPPPH